MPNLPQAVESKERAKRAADPRQDTIFDADLIRRYDRQGPRYTSYPTAVQFQEGFDAAAYRHLTEQSNAAGGPLSLYVHVPFCHSLCYYCGCTKVVTRHPERATEYLDYLFREIELQSALFDSGRPVQQLHLGGGTPTFLSDLQLGQLMHKLDESFNLDRSGDHEFSIELDPRSMAPERLDALRRLGFNRLSLGVQDFDPNVQRAVNRVQSIEETLGLIEHGRECGFKSVSIDLIYGLPLQTVESFDRTLDIVLDARPDRIAAYSYAHLPRMFRAQKLIHEDDLPDPAEKLAIFGRIMDRLTNAGYVYIGMDHFALPDDDLVIAQQQGRLHRNFQGYSTHAECDLIGLGVSSIGKIGSGYAQNARQLRDYYGALDDGLLPTKRGVVMSSEDWLRWTVIQEIMCHGRLEFGAVERQYQIDFASHFADELTQLRELARDGLIEIDDQGMTVTRRGRILVRIVATVFDAYLNQAKPAGGYSKVI